MSRAKDLIGETFGKLTVLKREGRNKHGSALWLCRCECGNEKIVSSNSLGSGLKSCGCLSRTHLLGERFGRLLVTNETDLRNGRRIVWECLCDCGNKVFATSYDLTSGHTKSCGCLMRETVSAMFSKHHKENPRLYGVWKGMRARCNNPNHDAYKNYGGRGIRVCDEWNDYRNFLAWAVKNGYDENAKTGDCTIDRINNDGNYEPDNCRWVDMKVQSHNKRTSRKENEA